MEPRPGISATTASALIIAIGDYDYHPRLASLAAAASDLAHALGKAGIVNAFPEGLNGGTSQELARRVRLWFEQAGNDDRLFFYWSGHGKREADGLYLITRDSPLSNFDQSNAVDPRSLAKITASSKAKKILFVLDACFSGEALGEVIGTISSVLGGQAPNVGGRRGIAVLASAHALQHAQEGVVSGILKEVLVGSGASRRWSDEDRFIDWDNLFASLEDEIESRAIGQRIVPATFGSTLELIPNPRYRPGLVAEVVEERSWRLAQSGAAEHFDLAARGIEVGESGWYFAGRTRVLHALVSWLSAAEHGVRIVTGPPGAGKSAVMGRLATLSDPEFRKGAMSAGVMPAEAEGTVPPESILDVAIHAKGKTLDDCARPLAEGLRVPVGHELAVDVDGLVAAIGRLGRRVTIMVDALDEAADGHADAIATRLVAPLGSLARVRVLVGSRRSLNGTVVPEGVDRHGRLRTAFGPSAIIDDLEDETTTHDDIADYVRRRLMTSRHCDDTAGIAAAAERVAARADGIFLYARIVSRTLQSLDRLDVMLPATALEAFAHDLQTRFGADERRVDDFLAALAWGEGKGFTRRVWPIVTNALATGERLYDDDDVAWVLGHAGWHIIESGADGQAVYRLAHQALADHYRSRLATKEAQGRIVEILAQGTQGAAWFDRDRYLWRHLADHAAQAGRLDALIRDPGYLAVADPARLLAVLLNIQESHSRRLADIYDRVSDRLIGKQPIDRLPLIHLTAQMEAPDLAPLLEPPVETRWRCRWARVRETAPHRVIGRHSSVVRSVAFGIVDGRPIVVSGSDDKTIRLWDARSGQQVSGPLQGHTSSVLSVALGTVDGRPVVVSGSEDGTVRLWDARSGQPLGAPLVGHSSIINSIALGAVDGQPVVVSGSSDRTIRFWDVRSGQPADWPVISHSVAIASINSVALGTVGGAPIVVYGNTDSTIRFWDMRSGRPICAPSKSHAGSVNSVVLGTFDGRPVVVSGGNDKTIHMQTISGKDQGRQPAWGYWQNGGDDKARATTFLGDRGPNWAKWQNGLKGHTRHVSSVAVGTVHGRPVVVSGSDDKTIRLWDLYSGDSLGRPLEGHRFSVTSVALGTLDGRPLVVSGSADRTIRLWDVRSDQPLGPLQGQASSFLSVALGRVGDRPIVVLGGGDKTIRICDAHTGQPIRSPLEGHTHYVNSVALGTVDRRSVIVSGGDITVRRWDVSSGQSIDGPLKGHTHYVSTVALGTLDGRPVVASGSWDRTVRLWDARSGQPLGEPLEGHANKVNSVALGTVNGRPVVVSGSSDFTVRLWDARSGHSIGGPFEGHTDVVTFVALGEVAGQPVLVSGSWDRTVRLWDARAGQPIGSPFEGHTDVVTFVALGEVAGRPVVVSGSGDGTIRLRDARTSAKGLVIEAGTAIRALSYVPDIGISAALVSGIIFLEDLRHLEDGIARGGSHATGNRIRSASN